MSMELHRNAESRMAEAELLEARGDVAEARRLFLQAADAEAAAFEYIPQDRPRTRGIIAVSAVSLYWRANAFDEAIRHAHRYLSLSGLPDAERVELEQLLIEVRRAKQAQAVGQAYSGRLLEISLRGPQFQEGLAPLDVLSLKYEQMRKLLIRSAEWVSERPFRQQGTVPEEVTQLYTPLVGAASIGSYRFQLHIQSPLQPRLFFIGGPAITADHVADAFFTVLRLTASDLRPELDERVPDRLYRETFMKLVRNFAPSGRELREIEIADRYRTDLLPVVLTQDVHKDLDQSIPKPDRERTDQPEPVGTLRALHLDESWLVLVEKGEDKKYTIAKDKVFDDVVGPFVNRRVRLVGSDKDKKFLVEDILLAEEDSSPQATEQP